MFGKGGGNSQAQQVSTHCRRARALITAWGPRSYPNCHPHSLPGTMLRERFTWLPSGWTTFLFQLHQHPSDLCPKGQPADLLASDWSLRSINSGDGCIHSSEQARPRGRGQGVCPGQAPSIRCRCILFYHFPIRRIWTWLMILGMTFELVQMGHKGAWLSKSEIQSFLNKENYSPLQNKLRGARMRIYLGECAQIKHFSKKGQS